jgi:hypothetical protein
MKWIKNNIYLLLLVIGIIVSASIVHLKKDHSLIIFTIAAFLLLILMIYQFITIPVRKPNALYYKAGFNFSPLSYFWIGLTILNLIILLSYKDNMEDINWHSKILNILLFSALAVKYMHRYRLIIDNHLLISGRSSFKISKMKSIKMTGEILEFYYNNWSKKINLKILSQEERNNIENHLKQLKSTS